MVETIGDDFQRITKYVRGKMAGGYLDWLSKPEIYKQFGDQNIVKLSFPDQVKTLSFNDTIRLRRSIRGFSSRPLSLELVGYLLWYSTE